MSNSPLVSCTMISPNKVSPRTHKIDTITIHCVVGQVTVEQLGSVFAPSSRKASSNYGVGKDGRIGMYVEEKDRSWCTSNWQNDDRAITIEVASDTYHPYAVTDAAYKGLIDLLVDICQRNDIKELKWKADKSLIGKPEEQNMTVHRWFDYKLCPGQYLYERHGQIAAEVNARLGVIDPGTPEDSSESTPVVKPESVISPGDFVRVKAGAVYRGGKDVSAWVKNKTWIVADVDGTEALIDKSLDGVNSIRSWINIKYLSLVTDNVDADTPICGYAITEFIRDIQKACGAAVDGIAGPETISKTVTLSAYKNSRHAAVAFVQKRLYELGYTEVGSADGVAGPKFTAAVKNFQKANGCVADGEITAKNKTWKKLLGMI